MCLKCFYMLALFVIQSCTVNNAYTEEKVQYEKDCHYYIVHLPGCKEYNPWIKNKREIIEFAKTVYDKYCPFCMSEYDVAMFDAISKRNIEKMRNWLDKNELVPSEYDMDKYYMYDEAERGYELYYVYNECTRRVEEYK